MNLTCKLKISSKICVVTYLNSSRLLIVWYEQSHFCEHDGHFNALPNLIDNQINCNFRDYYAK